MTTNPVTPLHTVDGIVGELVEVLERIEQLTERATHLKARLAEDIGVGNETTVGDLTIAVRGPSRRFNVDKAAALLTEEQRQVCTVTSLDPKKVKAQLPPVLLDEAMEPGTGKPIVTVK